MAVSTTTTTPTGWAADAAYQNWLQASQAINRPYEAYPGNMLAGWTPQQWQASQATNDMQTAGRDAMLRGNHAAAVAAGYQPQQVAPGWASTMATGAADAGPAAWMSAASTGPTAQMDAATLGRNTIRDVTAQSFLDRDVNAYMNPYINTVVNNSLRDLSRQNDIVNNATNARAAAAGAFGGSRQAVANTLNNENYLRESGNLSGNLRNQGYNTAAQLIQQDNDRNLTAQQLNQGMDWNVGNLNTSNRQAAGMQNMLQANEMQRYNASNAQQAALQNMAAQNERAQYNATNLQNARVNTANAYNQNAQFNADQLLKAQGLNQAAGQNAANTGLSAANALNSMGLDQQRWYQNNAQALWNTGLQQQQQEQAGLNDAYARWQQQYNYPLTQADQLRAALQGAPIGETTVSPGAQTNRLAGMASGALGGAQLAYGLSGGLKGWTGLGAAAGGLLGGLF